MRFLTASWRVLLAGSLAGLAIVLLAASNPLGFFEVAELKALDAQFTLRGPREAESPIVLDAVLALSAAFDKTSLTPQEQQVVQLTVSARNDCNYCRTVHTGLGRKAGLDGATVRATVAFEPLADRRLNALRDFARALVEDRGRVPEAKVDDFLSAGYTRAQVFEVVMGVALKILTNYCNHLVGAQPNAEFVAMAR